jgi:hypothetical protein
LENGLTRTKPIIKESSPTILNTEKENKSLGMAIIMKANIMRAKKSMESILKQPQVRQKKLKSKSKRKSIPKMNKKQKKSKHLFPSLQ